MFDGTSGSNNSGAATAGDLRISIVPSRRSDLEQALAGYAEYKIPLVAIAQGQPVPAGFSDDPGVYYFIPLVARMFRTSVDTAINLFYLSTLGIAFLFGASGFWLLFLTWRMRAIAIVWLLVVTFFVYLIGDLYLFEYALPAAVVPWAIWWILDGAEKFWIAFCCFLSAVAVLVASAAFIRITAGLPMVVFLLGLLLFSDFGNTKKKGAALCLFIVGLSLSGLYFKHLLSERDDFLGKHSVAGQEWNRHAFWHFAYIGLGFLHNGYVLGSCDDFNKEVVHAIDPAAVYLSAEYDAVLRHETLSILYRHPFFLLFTVAAKVGIVACIILIFGNTGLFKSQLPQSRKYRLPLWLALLMSAAPLLIVVPLKTYMVGLISYSTLLGIIGVLPVRSSVRSLDESRSGMLQRDLLQRV